MRKREAFTPLEDPIEGSQSGKSGWLLTGFTLIELLVVIAIIVLLMAILLPTLQRVKKQSKAVACQSNLHQWAIIFGMYAGENDGCFWSGDMHKGGWKQYCWIYPLQPYYYGEAKIRFCPMATKLRADGARDPFAAWGPVPLRLAPTPRRVPQTQDDCSSYGMNNWVCNPLPEVEFIHRREATEDNWRSVYVEGTSTIPLFLDCAYVEGKPYDFDIPPEYNGDIATWGVSALQMKRFCLDRHDGYINGLFLDFSVKKVSLKELWTLKWHREFDTAGPWTKSGGVLPTDWPEWMKRFKDY